MQKDEVLDDIVKENESKDSQYKSISGFEIVEEDEKNASDKFN